MIWVSYEIKTTKGAVATISWNKKIQKSSGKNWFPCFLGLVTLLKTGQETDVWMCSVEKVFLEIF